MKNNKGFTLVELLAVVVILALLMAISIPAVSKWIDRSRKENLDSQKSMLIMATQTYIENHTTSLPKAVGESTKIKASDLKAINYLNSDIKDGSNRNCTEKSYVKITKKENNNYDYEAFIYCEGDTIPEEVENIGTTPKITVKWTDALGSETPSENVSISKVIIMIEDRLNPLDRSVGLNTYRYVISANYEEKDKTVEIYNSENIQAEGKSTLTIEKDLTKLVDVSKITNFEIQVEAYTTDGGHLVVEDRFYYKDTIKPLCGQIVGEARDNEWTNGNRKISVECKDNNGSGCIQDVYAKTFKDESEFGYITITDKAGKSENCRVKVHIERQKPTADITFNNNISNKTLTIKMNDNKGLSKYYFGTSNPGNTTVSYTNISGTTNTVTPTITNGTTYYLRIYDIAGNFEDYSRVFYKTILTPNKSSVSPNNIITLSGNSFTIPTPMETTGYTFGGWYKENTLVNSAGTTYTPTANTTLYGKWNANPYSINYIMNGGVKGTNGPTSTNYDKTVVIDKPTKTFTVTIDGNSQGATLSSTTASSTQTFSGWSATNIESTTRYGTSEANITSTWNGTEKIGAGNNTLYFKNLRSTNGTVNMTANWTAVNVTLPTVTKTGYVCGYATTGTGNVTYVSGASYTPSIFTNNATLYVKCNPNTYTISYMLNGGVKGTNEPKNATYDSNVTVSRPTKTFIVNIDANSQGASIKVGDTSVISVSGAQTFDGWTSTGLNTTTAKYGTTTSDITASWNGTTKIGAANDPIYLKNLNPTNGGSVVLTANWIATPITLPAITKDNYDCGYATKASGDIEYESGKSYTPSIEAGSTNLYAKCKLKKYKITLNNQNASVIGTTEIYEIYNVGYYLDSDLTKQMSVNKNSITVPFKIGYQFMGYFTEPNGEGINYIDINGNITSKVSNTYFKKDGILYAYFSNKLYDVLKKESLIGTYAREYTGAHQDSFTNTGNKNIYHWYATSNANGTAILDKNNVLFAGQCWQMIRTTDTGGVKLIYNGEAENNQCLNTRGTHIGYGNSASQTLNSSYYYGTDYTYDSSNNVFTLAGTLEQATWNATTGPTLIGKYTCKSASETGTCSTLYLIESYNNTTSAYAFPITKNSHYSQFGTLAYNNSYDSPAYVGYMYNDVYPVTFKSNTFYVQNNTWTVNTSYYYSDTIDWNTTANQYTLSNPQQLSTLSGDYSSLVGKYILNGIGMNAQQAIYIVGVSGTSLYYKTLSNGDINISLTIGDSYTESGGVYTLSGNVTNVPYQTWYNSTSLGDYKGKYVCDGNNTSCTNIKHIYPSSNPSKTSYSYFDSANAWQFAESVSYNGTNYTLTGDIKTLWDYYDTIVQATIATHHYTCLNNGTSCTTVGYISNFSDSTLYYAKLSNVTDIETAFNNMLYKADVNIKNSPIKSAVDAWYAKYLSGYDTYLEDTIFCNDRTIKSKGAWDPDGGAINQYLQFQEYSISKDLSCDRATDQFSTLNNSAKLTYKVGLMSNPEMNLLNDHFVRNTGQFYWLASPLYFSNLNASVRSVSFTGVISNGGVQNSSHGVRPAISILPGTVYTSGDGSMVSPYTIE